jgi:hypothetical protein
VEVKPEPERQSERVANEVPLAGGIGQRKLVIWGSYQALLVHTISLFFQPDRKRVYYFIFFSSRGCALSLAIMPIVSTGSPVPTNIAEFFREKWRGPKACSLCGVTAWNIEPELAELRFLSTSGALRLGVPVIPLVVLTCTNCGNTLLINAVRAGWHPSPPGASYYGPPGGGL